MRKIFIMFVAGLSFVACKKKSTCVTCTYTAGWYNRNEPLYQYKENWKPAETVCDGSVVTHSEQHFGLFDTVVQVVCK